MANLVDLLMRLERRLIVVEKALGVTPESGEYLHPKALTQADAKSEAAQAELLTKETK